MVDEHSKMLDEVKQLAQSKGVELPSAPDAKHEKAVKRLETASGADFDRQYMNAMIKDHKDALKLAQRTAKGAKDADLSGRRSALTPVEAGAFDRAR